MEVIQVKENSEGEVDSSSANSQHNMPIDDRDVQAWLGSQELWQPVTVDTCPLVELCRRTALRGSGVDGFAGLDVWSYGKSIRGLDGEDTLKMGRLWEEICGDDTRPLVDYGYFALPLFPEMLALLSEQELCRTERFINPTLRISFFLGHQYLRLTVKDGTPWNKYTLETFLRAWELLVAWYKHALEELLQYNYVARSIDESFSIDHCRHKAFRKPNEPSGHWREHFEVARHLID